MTKVWYTGKTIKDETGDRSDIKDDHFYLFDKETKSIDWTYMNNLQDMKDVPTYDDILRELDVPLSNVKKFIGEGPQYNSILKLYAIKRGISVEELKDKIKNPDIKQKEIKLEKEHAEEEVYGDGAAPPNLD